MADPVAMQKVMQAMQPPEPTVSFPLGSPRFGLGDTWPARLAKSLYSAVTLPGDVYQGNVSMYGADGRTNPEVINRAADLAGTVTLGAGAMPAEANSLRAGIKRPVQRQLTDEEEAAEFERMLRAPAPPPGPDIYAGLNTDEQVADVFSDFVRNALAPK
jgi:hypothetical protein